MLLELPLEMLLANGSHTHFRNAVPVATISIGSKLSAVAKKKSNLSKKYVESNKKIYNNVPRTKNVQFIIHSQKDQRIKSTVGGIPTYGNLKTLSSRF